MRFKAIWTLPLLIANALRLNELSVMPVARICASASVYWNKQEEEEIKETIDWMILTEELPYLGDKGGREESCQ